MIQISTIRENADAVQKDVLEKGSDISISNILDLDKQHRSFLSTLNDLRAKRNKASQAIGAAKRVGEDASAAVEAMQSVAGQIKQLETQAGEISNQLNTILLTLPNLPHETVPAGKDEKDNQFIRNWGEESQFDFVPEVHSELGKKLNLFDFDRGSKMSGSGFPLYTGKGAKLERAMINFMLDHHVDHYHFTEIFPPFVVRPEAMQTTGQLPKFEEDMYHAVKDDLYLIPTAEVPVTNIHRDEILSENDLPLYYAAYSACFRREAGSYGKDTRGFLRLHQFNKVELVKFVLPENSYAELESLTKQAESILQALGLHYRVIELCRGDLSFSAAKCYDIEVWAPGEKKWLEVSSCSNFESFQARRGQIKFRRNSTKKTEFVHTLNGSGVATPRLLVALLETFQTSKGTIKIPEILHPYTGFTEID